jgi:hypothetical protein
MDADWFENATEGKQFFEAMDNNDSYLRAIMDEQGFNALPTVLPDEQFDQLADQGWTVTHRGISAESDSQLRDYVTQFTEGDPYVSKGLFGNGIYTTDLEETARGYADTSGLGIGQRGGPRESVTGTTLDIAIHPDARVIEHEDLFKIREERVSVLREQESAMREQWPSRSIPHPYEDGAIMEERIPMSELKGMPEHREFADRAERIINYDNIVSASDDVGKVAAMEGYDVIKVSTPRAYQDFQLIELPDTYYVILNRGAVAVREPKL